MAIASCSVKLISRGQGRSAVAAAAYRSGTKMQNEYDGLSHDYTRKRDITYTAILAPQNSQDWVYDRAKLWNQAELTERRGNSRLAREVMIALPCELSQEQNIQLARAYAGVFVEQGMVADVSVHDKGDGNPHAHIMLTTRFVDGDKFGKKCRDWDSRERLIEWRDQYAELTNQYLERYGYDQRIDARSYAAQGIEQIPTIHLGPYAHRMKQQGVYTERWEINQRIEEQNKEIAKISKQIGEYEKEAEQLKSEVAQEQKWKQEELEEQDDKAQEIPEPEPASIQHNRFLERYMRVAQSIHKTQEPLQDILTEKGMQDFTGEKTVETVREPVPQRAQEPETPFSHTRVEESERKRLHDSATLYPEQKAPPHHPKVEEPDREPQRQQDYDALFEAAKQKRKEHRLVRDPERPSRRYQDAYEQAEEKARKISRREQTAHHGQPEPPRPEQQPDRIEKYRIAERRHHELERQKRRYDRSRDDPDREK